VKEELEMNRRAKAGTLAALLAVMLVAIGGVALRGLAAAEGTNGNGKKAVKLNPNVVAMADNSWLKMNPKKEPEGRNYSGCCLADWGKGPKIFYFGGGHFSYDYDDAAIYDVATNAWTRSWPQARKYKPFLSKDPEEKKKQSAEKWKHAVDAGRLPPTHTYQLICWVPERKVFAYVGYSGHWEYDAAAPKWTAIALPPRCQYPDMPEELKRFSPWTKIAVQTHHLFYSPEAGAPLSITTHRPKGDWLYDAKKKEWKRLKRDIGNMGGELYSTYVPTLKASILSNNKKGFYLHKMVKDGASWKTEWTAMENVPKELLGCKGLAYDFANDVVIALKPGKKREVVRTFCLDVKTMKWSETKPLNPPKGEARFAPLWYEPEHNAFFFLARTGQTKCETWFYRYKRRKTSK
jgi:hypothetical protein